MVTRSDSGARNEANQGIYVNETGRCSRYGSPNGTGTLGPMSIMERILCYIMVSAAHEMPVRLHKKPERV